MAESQSHGILFEDTVIRAITSKSKSDYEKLIENGYTSAFDLHKGILADFNGSVKTAGGTGIGCGDICRFLSHCRQESFTMIIGQWNQVDRDRKHYHSVLEFDFTPSQYTNLFGELTEELIRPFVDWVRAVPEGKPAQLEARPVYKQKRQEILDAYDCGIASIDVKIDSKTQRRVQLGLKINDLIDRAVPHRLYTTNYRGIDLPYEQISQARKRKRT
jgi:hypothetical protein